MRRGYYFMNLFGFLDRFKAIRYKDGSFSFFGSDVNGFEDNSDYLKLSLENPVLFSILALRSKMVSQMKINHIDKKGNIIDNSPYTKLLSKPNYFQTQEDFIFQAAWFMGATGNDYVYQIKPYKTLPPTALYNLIPTEIDFREQLKLNFFIASKDQMTQFDERVIDYKLDDQNYKLKLGDLIPMYDVANGLDCNSFMQSPSRVKSILKPLQNIDQALASKNKNIKMSAKYLGRNKNTIQGMPAQIDAKDRTAIEMTLSAKDIILTNGDIDFQHLVSNMKNLYLDEMISKDAQMCTLAFGLNNDVLNFFAGGSSTFENQEKGELRAFQNEISQIANNILKSFTNSFGLDLKGEKLVASYDHLPIMQAVILEKLNTFKVQQEALSIALANGSLTQQEAVSQTNELMIKLGLWTKN
jgi:hypothetical protein